MFAVKIAYVKTEETNEN